MIASHSRESFLALFEPRGVVVAGASTHPGKFGFVALHNLLASGYEGEVFATNLSGEVGARHRRPWPTSTNCPMGAIDLVFVCTPTAANPDIVAGLRSRGDPGGVHDDRRLRRSRGAGARGRGRTGRARRRARDPVGRAQRAGRGVDAGPPVRPDRGAVPARRAGSVSPASRATSCRASSTWRDRPGSGSAERCRPATPPQSTVADYLDFYADDRATAVVARLRRGDHRRRSSLMRRLGDAASRKPLVLLKGGADRRRGACGGEPHRSVGGRRQGVRRRLPGVRDHARR